jgi:hypothetical protein
MRLVLRGRNSRDVDCLMRELAVYSPTRRRRAVVIDLGQGGQLEMLGVLSAAKRCLETNQIPSVKVEIDGKGYLMTSPAV